MAGRRAPPPPSVVPLPEQARRGAKRAPRWTIAFLRALVRTGDVRAAAADAGIDHSTAYARRRANAEFAGLWRGALAVHAKLAAAERSGELEALRQAPPPRSVRARSPIELGEEMTVANGQVKRVGHDRWNKRKEKIFFDELMATNNIRRSAEAAGVSYNAVLARRLKHPLFRAKWEAVVKSAKAGIGMYLLEASKQTFDPETLDLSAPTPKVSVAEAIRIVQAHGSKKEQEELPDPFAEQAASMTPDDVHELREKLVRKLRRLRDRDMPKRIAEGWSLDPEHDHMVPPGWVRG